MLEERTEKFVAGLGLSMLSLFLFFFLLVIAPMVGGVCGWLFALIFNDSFAALMSLLRWDATGFEAGAALAFLGAFLKAGARITKD